MSTPADAADPTDALSAVPTESGRRAATAPGRLRFFYGPMDCGKSTLALQIDHNHARQGRVGLLLVRFDRSGSPRISTRIGLARQAIELDETTDVRGLVRAQWAAGRRVDYVIVDEAQFLNEGQVEQLAELADLAHLDVYCFGIATDFRGRLFPGAQRLFEVADELQAVQVEVLCWCGSPGRFNGRVVNGSLVRAGDTVLVADTTGGDGLPSGDDDGADNAATTTVRYQVLCRRHFRSGDLGPIPATHGQLTLA
ncbi:thymidine kinase [Actinoalloteichus spitiensis]|uniref:thymidine kinase n=1 Tax=Actinoalloteichus spitiensis TaxID=252394 RepID=UPI000361DD7E|nr:thymidine kinase [Actinoalloteichus spitiensis]